MLPGYRSGNVQVEWQEIKSSELSEYVAEAKPAPILIDVRPTYIFAQGHIAGAINLPLSSLSEHLADLDPDRAYVTLCHSGKQARKAAAMLAEQGIKEIGVLLGGMDAWEGPIVR